ncbi:hypothetical protein GYMLUDRAFT_232803 [Collybiopsis luxurians FD-317 M1]|uniref:Unplaced genomic scaffold GYMLUscaffold_81, whole genome shotgun sequence n=1 Tax=Collybiopsis luxurians FD-317 M1 TaxID=944289 RepID=A0A0D0BFM5_9AGAR|nr:hypothetical protein GYMLUDRAFT_232803 [Collybiopsis luxurians FD-317 M1]
MSTKHVYTSSEGLVLKSLQGAVALNPSLRLHRASKSVYTFPPSSQTKVSVISGGGAGHEPAHASYTGYGMLAASVSGEIFASPSAKQILSTIRLAAFAGDESHLRNLPSDKSSTSSSSSTAQQPPPRLVPHKDVLVIINNYTGDRLNFGLAIEKARAEGIRIDSIVVADDVSLLDSPQASVVGPRGLAGNIIVCKILGALAERGSSLENMKWVGEAGVNHLASIGVGLEHCHVPGSKSGSAGMMGDDECEVGLGLHNEPGVRRMQMQGGDSAKLVDEMVGKILRSRGVVDGGRDSFVEEGDTTVLFVNNLGGMSQLEMGAIVYDVLGRLALSDIHPVRIYSSSYMTSLNAPGFSISLLNVSAIHRTPRTSVLHRPMDILQLLDDPTEAHSWVGVKRFWPADGMRDVGREEQKGTERILEVMRPVNPDRDRDQRWANVDVGVSFMKRREKDTEKNAEITTFLPGLESENATTNPNPYWRQTDISPERVTEGIVSACRAVLKEEAVLTEYDTIVGDGDCGVTFARGANAILKAIENQHMQVVNLSPDQLVLRLGEILEDNMGGTIGALFAIFFTAWAAAIKRMVHPSPSAVSGASASASPGPGPGSGSAISSVRFMDTLEDALGALAHHTPAKPGDRTLMDALVPLCTASSSSSSSPSAAINATTTPIGGEGGISENNHPCPFTEACIRAKEGALSTKGMKPKLGRAVYVGVESQGKEGSGLSELPMDPGAWGVSVLAGGFWDRFCDKRYPGK